VLSLIDDILKELSHLAKIKSVRKHGKYRVLLMVFDKVHYQMVVDALNRLTDTIAEKGEKITCKLTKGTVVDMGAKSLEINRGFFIELYDYDGLSVYFIRVYEYVSETKSWVSLYVDENPETPWWIKQERMEPK